MRRPVATLVTLCFALIVSCIGGYAPTAVAATTPLATLKAAFVPLPGYTGALGASAVGLQAEYAISDAGYGASVAHPLGGASPLAELDIALPQSVALNTAGFSMCSEIVLRNYGPSDCPRGSTAGPLGSGLMEVSFGAERVPEQVSLQPFVSTGGSLVLAVTGSSPVSVEFIAQVAPSFSTVAPYGQALHIALPALETVPGAPLASVKSLALGFGTTSPVGASASSLLTLAGPCTSAGLPLASELTFGGSFGGEREFGISPERVSTTTVSPCPMGTASSSLGEAVAGTGGIVSAPSNKACVSRRDFTIHVLQIKGLVYRRIEVAVNGVPVKVVRGHRTRTQVDLRGLPKGRYTVRITVTTTSGRRVSGTRAYHTCARKRLPGGNPRL